MRPNNFDIVRLLLSIVVVLVHSGDLSGSSSLDLIREALSARLAVECFFVISGFLIFASYERCSTLREYIFNRALRILPGYWLSTLVCLVIAFTHGRLQVGKFLLANLTFANFLHGGIPGVFTNNPGGTAMNGALWTIKIEVMFYLCVPLIVRLCRHLKRDLVLWCLMAASIAFRLEMVRWESLAVQLPGQLSFFMAGALIYYHLNFFRRYGRFLMLGSVALFGLHLWSGCYAIRPLAVGGLTLGLCLLFPPVRGPTRWGDFSYGLYILHWPVIQLATEAGWFREHPWGALILTFTLVAVGAIFSWRLIERPFLELARSRRDREAASRSIKPLPSLS